MTRKVCAAILVALILTRWLPIWQPIAAAVAQAGTMPAVGHSATASLVGPSWTVSATNGAIVVELNYNSLTITSDSIVWSGTGGAPVRLGTIRGGAAGTVTSVIWCIPAVASSTGTITSNTSLLVDQNFNADVYSGVDQATPCTDWTTSIVATSSLSLTPANLTANDGMAGMLSTLANLANPCVSVGNPRLRDTAGTVSICAGDNTGTNGITTADSGGGSDDKSRAAVRIAAVATGSVSHSLGLLKVGS